MTRPVGRPMANICILLISTSNLLQQAMRSCGWLILMENRNSCSVRHIGHEYQMTDHSSPTWPFPPCFLPMVRMNFSLRTPMAPLAHSIPLSGSDWTHNIIDAPLFLPDGRSILFSAPVQRQSSAPSWVEKLMGITVVHAHGYIPSDWWSVPLAGGEPVRLTHVYSPGLFASLSPDAKYIASYSSSGIFVMDLQGGT